MLTYENIKPPEMPWSEFYKMTCIMDQKRSGEDRTSFLEVAISAIRDTNIWSYFITDIVTHKPMQDIKSYLEEARKTKNIYPDSKQIFRAFKLCPYHEMKVVIIGQDPYHQPGTADGLAFSTNDQSTPASLRNIFKEIKSDEYERVQMENLHKTNSLAQWAIQGVLLLNTVLTVEEGKANAHKNIGWDYFVGKVFEELNNYYHPLVFMLWGAQAQSYAPKINSKHLVLTASHPASESYKQNAGFFGCKHFSKANQFIRDYHKKTGYQRLEINWTT